MGFFDEWLRNGKPDRKKLSNDVVKGIDRYDRQDLDRISEEMRDFRIARDALCEVADTGGHLTSDAFFIFLKSMFELHEPGDINPQYLINRSIEEEMQKLPEFERLRTWTEGDIVSSAAAFVTVEPDLETLHDRAQTFAEEAAEFQKHLDEMGAAEQGKRDLDEMVEAWKNLQDPDDEEAQTQQQALQELMDKIAADMAAQQEALAAEADSLEADAASAGKAAIAGLRRGMAQAADDAEQLSTAARGWGIEPGDLQKMSAAERIALAERLKNPKFERIAELWGPMSRIANTEQTRKVYHSFEEVYDVSVGSDLMRLLPQEFANLHHPLLKYDFYKRYNEDALFQYEMQGTEKVGKGGIYMCLDNSGSMVGEPEMWAKAVGLCALHIAREQKREFYGIHFSSRGQIECFDFRKPEDITVDRVLEYAEHFFNGGTDYVTPFDLCVALLEEEFRTKGHVDGDIVFVTDGLCGVTDEWLANFKATQARLGFKVWGLMIGGYRQGEPLWTICDQAVVTITDLLSGEELHTLFREL